VKFFENRGFDFISLNVETVLSFLQLFVGKSSSRIKTAIAALKFFLRVYHREDLADNPLISMFGKGAKNLAPLPREKPSIWNPEIVLNAIQALPFPSSFLECAKEAVLLLLLATGWRVDDVWKLSVRFESFEEYARFFFCSKRKCPVKGVYTTSQAVSRFSSQVRICPVQAVERFLEKAKSMRKLPSEALFQWGQI
jgi:hypothetical protein